MWDGYLSNKFKSFCKDKKLSLEYVHTSGHAQKEDLKSFQSDGSIIEWDGKLIQITAPKTRRTIDYNIEKRRFVGKEGI